MPVHLLAAADAYFPLQIGGLGVIAALTASLLKASSQNNARVDKQVEARVKDLRGEIERLRDDNQRERHKRESADKALRDCWRKHYGVELPGEEVT